MKRQSYVYLIEGAGLVKIGWGYNPKQRVASMQIGSPVPLTLLAKMPGDYSTEQRIQKRFEKCWVHGEWYRLSDEQREELIKEFGGKAEITSRCYVCDEPFVGDGFTCAKDECKVEWRRSQGLPW
jgi:hypothetical protein